jgi:hypothetical protein
MTKGATATRRIVATVAVGLCLPVLVAQTSAPRVMTWETSIRGEKEATLHWPVAIAAASANEIAVADVSEPRLVVFHRTPTTWKVARTVKLPATPLDVIHDGERYVLSLRQAPGLLAVEGADYRLRNLAVPQRTVPGVLAEGPSGSILVHDAAGERVLLLHAGGEFEVIGPVAGNVTGLTSTPGGGFIAAFAAEAAVVRYGANGDEIGRWAIPGDGPVPAWPTDVAVHTGGDLVVVDRHNARLLVLDAGGRIVGQGARSGWDAGLLRFPTGLARLADGRFVVADTGNGRVQIFALPDEEPGS